MNKTRNDIIVEKSTILKNISISFKLHVIKYLRDCKANFFLM